MQSIVIATEMYLDYINYCIAGIFQGVKFLWFSWLRGEP